MNKKIHNIAIQLGIVLLTTVTPLMADKGNSENKSIASPKYNYNGHSYSEWGVKWFQYANSLPLSKHPLNDTADCSVGQKGDVWFLGGSLGRPYPAEGRDCTIPPGTAIFFNVGAQSWDNEGCDGKKIKKTSLSENELRNNTQTVLNQSFGARKIIIDGVEVKGLPKACDSAKPGSCQSGYRIQTPVFDYKVPARDSTLVLFNGACYDNPNNGQPYKVKNTVGEGYFVMIKPLALGKHTLRHFKVDATGKPTRLYNITVSKKPHKKEYQTSKNSFN